MEFRDILGPSSGFQSLQYRTVEFLMGNKNAALLKVFAHDAEGAAGLRAVLEAPPLSDEFLRYLARWGHAVPQQARTSVVSGKSVPVRVDLGGLRIIKKKKN